MKSQIHDHSLWQEQDKELDWNQQLDYDLHSGWNRIRNLTGTSSYICIWFASWLEQAQELEPTESVTHSAWIRFAEQEHLFSIPVSNWNRVRNM